MRFGNQAFSRIPPAALSIVTISPISLGSVHQTRQLVQFAAEHAITVPIAATYPFDDAASAFAHYIQHRPAGKILIRA